MKLLVLFLVFLVALSQSASSDGCGQNEVYNSCGSACDPTCDEPYPTCIEMCVDRCECKPGFVKDLVSKKCIDQKQCPKKD